LIEDQNCTPHIPPKSNRYDGITYSKAKYKKRNLSERCFNKLKQFRHIATRYDRSARSTTSLCSKLLASDYGFGFMSPRPRSMDFRRAHLHPATQIAFEVG